MSKITKEQVLENLEEVKKFISESENKTEEKVVGLAIKNRFTGSIIFQSTKTTWKEAVVERLASDADLRDADLRVADLSGADLSGANLSDADLSVANLSVADLRGANLRGAELNCAKFYGRGGTKQLKKSQLPDFLGALGFIIAD